MTVQSQRLYRSKGDRLVAGVCGGLGTYFGLDSTVVRLIWAVVTVLTGIIPGVLVYLLFMVIVPAAGLSEGPERSDEGTLANRTAAAGLLLLLLGGLLLLSNFGFFSWLSWGRLWPLLLILPGIALLVRR